MKLIIHSDMDDTLGDFKGQYALYKEQFPNIEYPQSLSGFFLGIEPIEGAIDTLNWLEDKSNGAVHIATAPSVKNPLCYTEKRLWTERYLGMRFVEKLNIVPDKSLIRGTHLIDDLASGKGQEGFEGELVLFGSEKFPDWVSIKEYFSQILS